MIDATRPVVSITGPRSHAIYADGHVPQPTCVTSEKISGVGKAATVAVHDQSPAGIGIFTAACSGARSSAGLAQAGPVRVSYAEASGFGGFITPAPGSNLAKSAPVVVSFRLTAAAGRPIAASAAATLAKARIVQATLRGPGIPATTVVCSWSVKASAFSCQIRVPRAARTGKSVRYTITAAENFGHGYLARPTGKRANPETIHFR